MPANRQDLQGNLDTVRAAGFRTTKGYSTLIEPPSMRRIIATAMWAQKPLRVPRGLGLRRRSYGAVSQKRFPYADSDHSLAAPLESSKCTPAAQQQLVAWFECATCGRQAKLHFRRDIKPAH
jgi:hypothetical protein